MSSKCLSAVAVGAFALLSFVSIASAQSGTASGPMTSDEAVSGTSSHSGSSSSGPSPTARDDPEHPGLLNYRGIEYSVGWRLWVMTIPQPIVGLFVNAASGWGGSVGVATGPEFTYRHDGFDITLALMYVDYAASGEYFRANGHPLNDEELWTSYLYGLYFTSSFLWAIHIHPMFEIQIGAMIGLGYIGGDLYRTQAYTTNGGGNNTVNDWHDCRSGAPGGTMSYGGQSFCDSTRNDGYFTNNPQGTGPGHTKEPGIFNGGDIPTIIPWVSIPHIALHIRPHRNIDIKVEGGYALIGFYGGASIHFIF